MSAAGPDDDLPSRLRVIEIETARLKLQVAQIQHLTAIRDAAAAGVPHEDILTELLKIGSQGAAIMAGSLREVVQ